MLYIADHNLVFLHIPKNAGQAMRSAIFAAATPNYAPVAQDLKLDEAKIPALMDQFIPIPNLGNFQIEHLDLELLRDHFPACFEVIRNANSFVLVRPPRARFISALMQRLGEHMDIKGLRIDDPRVRQEAENVCALLAKESRERDSEYIHFYRQTNYTDLDGQRVVSALFPMDRIASAEQWIKSQTGLALEVKRDHVRREPKKWSQAIQPLARFAGRRLIPQPLKRAIYPYWKNSAAFSDAAGRYDSVTFGDAIESFIADYYASDARLYKEACAFCDTMDKAK